YMVQTKPVDLQTLEFISLGVFCSVSCLWSSVYSFIVHCRISVSCPQSLFYSCSPPISLVPGQSIFLRPRSSVYPFHLYHIRKRALRVFKIYDPRQQQGQHHNGTNYNQSKIRALPSQKGPPKPFDDSHHGIEAVQQAPLLGDHADWIGNRARKHPDLRQERNRVAHVTISYIEC